MCLSWSRNDCVICIAGIVSYASASEAKAAIRVMDGFVIGDKTLSVREK